MKLNAEIIKVWINKKRLELQKVLEEPIISARTGKIWSMNELEMKCTTTWRRKEFFKQL